MVPVRRVGLYAPGGLAPLVSSVVMNVVPAQVPGVASIALASSPRPDHAGLPEPTILAACALLGVDEVYAVGGAQAIAMFAYGAGECERVDLVTGPGNIYTVAAKRLLKGRVGIDAEAGPTEIAILADDSADAAYVAADLRQPGRARPARRQRAGHRLARLADDVEAELDKQVHATRHIGRVEAALGGRQSGIVLVDDLEQGLDVVNAYAAEHLEIHTVDAASVAARVVNAGAVFVGPYSRCHWATTAPAPTTCCPPEGLPATPRGCPCGPSAGRSTSSTTPSDALAEVADHVVTLAEAEDLPGHGEAVKVRFSS